MRVVSGVQPTDEVHLGHYFGALREHVELQDEAECFFFIADYHALTALSPGTDLERLTRRTAAIYLACGLDPERAALYRQSAVPEVCELDWLLTTVTPIGQLERGVAYKEARQHNRSCSAGLFTYPVLMAADVLLVGGTVVPVGRDQVQHLEIAREICHRFNSRFGAGADVFALPQTRLSRTPFVPGTDGEKMSKRHDNTIGILDEGEALAAKVKRIRTDSRPREAPKVPETSTIFILYSLMATEEERLEMAERYRSGGYSYDEAKARLKEKIEEHFAPVRQRFRELERSPEAVDRALDAGARRARQEARRCLERARGACGLPAATEA